MKSSSILIASSLLACSCTVEGTDDLGVPADPAGRSLRDDLLLGPISFAFEPRASAAFVTASVFDGDSWQAHPTSLDLTAGTAQTSSDLEAGLWLDRLELRFADVSLGEFGLSDLQVSVSAPHPCDAERWVDADDRVEAELTVAFDLDWSLVTREGTIVPLETQSLAASDLDLTIRRDPDGDEIGLSLVNPETMWEWAGLLRIEGVMLSAGGRASEPAVDSTTKTKMQRARDARGDDVTKLLRVLDNALRVYRADFGTAFVASVTQTSPDRALVTTQARGSPRPRAQYTVREWISIDVPSWGSVPRCRLQHVRDAPLLPLRPPTSGHAFAPTSISSQA